jgi:hypothetical protein
MSTRPSSSACRHGSTESSSPPHSAQRSRWASASSVGPIEIRGSQLIGGQWQDVRVALGGDLFERGMKRVQRD